MPAAALDKNLGTKTANAAGTTITLTTAFAVAANAKIFVFVMWAGAPTLSSLGGGGLTWRVEGQQQSGGFNIGLASADAPAGLASATVLTATFSASATNGLMCGVSFTGVATGAALAIEKKGNASGTAIARWGPINTGVIVDQGGLAIGGSCTDNSGTSTPQGDATELHDFSDVNFFGALTSQYQIIPFNKIGNLDGTWSTVAGSLSNNGIVALWKDTAGVTLPIATVLTQEAIPLCVTK